MLMIRLQRTGRRNLVAYRVIVTDSKASVTSGKNVEVLGSFNPHTNALSVDRDRIKYWMSKGVKVSDTVHNLFVTQGIMEGKKINVLPRKSPLQKEGDTQAAPVQSAEAAPAPEEKNASSEAAAA